jgi:hypothetical protein
VVNSAGIGIFLLLACVTLLGDRRWAVMAIMAGVLYLTLAQSVNVGGANLSAIRLLELTAVARITVRREFIAKAHRIDALVALLYAYTVLVFFWRSDVDHAYILGISVDAALSYFLFRSLIVSAADLRWFLRGFTLLLVPYVVMLGVETATRENPFAIIGGLSFVERDGRLRCMGSFRHPSLLGTLGAAFLPLYFALACEAKGRFAALVGILLCLAIIVFANSGGPVSAATVGAIGWVFWHLRNQMSFVRRSLAATVALLALFMKAPLWYLPAKASSFSGGDGWHRSYLMDVAFRHFDKWWLAGIDMDQTKDWFHYQLSATGSADITNQYLYFGLTAGVPSTVLFILLLTSAFQGVGRALESTRSSNDFRDAEYLVWGLGCCVAVHAATWLGITYNFDQTYIIWSLQLAAISSIAASVAGKLPEAEHSNLPTALGRSW